MKPPSPTRAAPPRLAGFAGAAALSLAAALVLAQWQVNPQVSGGGRVNNRVGGEMYGNMGSVKYAAYQTRLLPSEERYATWRSGALPSEVAMGAAATGPLAPNGVINYLPPPNAVQQAGRAPAPQLYNPAYGIGAKVDPGPMPMTGYGTIRYAPQASAGPHPGQVASPMISGAIPSAQLPGGQLPSGQLPTGQVTGQVKPVTPAPTSGPPLRAGPSYVDTLSSPAPAMGSIRYASPTVPAPAAGASRPAGK